MEEIVGVWKNFVFLLASEADLPEVSQHVRDFFLRDEAMNTYLGWSEDNARDHEKLVQLALTHGLSFIIREKHTGELAGVNIVLDSRCPGFDTLFSSDSPMSPHLTKILTFITNLEESTEKTFQHLFPCDYFAEIFITSVSQKYRGCGMVTEIYKRMISLLKSHGFHVIKSGFTSPATRAIGRKLGFTELGRLYFKNQINHNGQRLFPEAGDGEEEYATETAAFVR